MILKSKSCTDLFFVDASILHFCVFKRISARVTSSDTIVCVSASLNHPNLEDISWQAITLNGILLLQKDSQGKIIWIYSEHIQRQGTMHSPCEFIIILRLSQAQWIWNANELVRIKKSLWSETSPNLLQDERYIAMAYAPSLSSPEPQR